jgi:PTS system mannose-specific IID component
MSDARIERTITRLDLAKVFVRSLLIQAAWSFERMQAAGFAYALAPALRKLYPDAVEFEKRLNAHADYFNTQPYFAAFILGAVIRKEEDRAAGRASDDEIAALKKTLMPPLGALGDSFFWGALRPMASAVAVALLILDISWAPLAFLALFNAGHISLRFVLIGRGYRSSGDAVGLMEHYRFPQKTRLFKALALAVLGGVAGLVPVWRGELRFSNDRGALALAVSFVSVAACVALVRRGVSPVQLILGLALVCLGLAYMGVLP